MMNTGFEWLATLDIGSEVVVQSNYGRCIRIRTVDRVTPTQVVVGDTRYRRKDGEAVGADPTYRNYLRNPTPELRQRAINEELREGIGNIARWFMANAGQVNDSTVEEVARLMCEAKAAAKRGSA